MRRRMAKMAKLTRAHANALRVLLIGPWMADGLATYRNKKVAELEAMGLVDVNISHAGIVHTITAAGRKALLLGRYDG